MMYIINNNLMNFPQIFNIKYILGKIIFMSLYYIYYIIFIIFLSLKSNYK